MPDEEFRKLQSKFYREREIISIPSNKVYDQVKHFRNSETEVRMKSHFTPTFLGDPAAGDIPRVFNGNAINTNPGNIQSIQAGPVIGLPNALALLPQDTLIEVVQIMAWMDTDANAANRVNGIQITPYMPDDVTAGLFVDTTTITLTANQVGGHLITSGQDHWTNTNGAIAQVANENPLPMILEWDSNIVFNTTNIQAGDTLAITAWYREVTP